MKNEPKSERCAICGHLECACPPLPQYRTPEPEGWATDHPTFIPLRLRVIDINTTWFWFTIFYEPFAYGESWLKIEVWEPHQWCKLWFSFWKWEGQCLHRNVTVTEDGGRCDDCKKDMQYDQLTRNWK